MGINRKVFGVFAAAVLSLSMFAGAAAQVPTNAELGFAPCGVTAADGSSVSFDMTWNGTHFEADADGLVVVEVTGLNALGGNFCLIDVALGGGELDGPGPYTIQQNRLSASVPGQPGGPLGQSFILQSFMSHNMTVEIDDLEGYHIAGSYSGTLDLSINTGP